MLVHGFDLDGATELAGGTRIFVGGVEAAVDAVRAGARSPLDFRWFVGRREGVSPSQGAWTPVACARPTVGSSASSCPRIALSGLR